MTVLVSIANPLFQLPQQYDVTKGPVYIAPFFESVLLQRSVEVSSAYVYMKKLWYESVHHDKHSNILSQCYQHWASSPPDCKKRIECSIQCRARAELQTPRIRFWQVNAIGRASLDYAMNLNETPSIKFLCIRRSLWLDVVLFPDEWKEANPPWASYGKGHCQIAIPPQFIRI